MAVALRRTCSCGHDRPAHSHYRRGSDCSGCSCAAYVGGFVLTVAFRAAPLAAVVVPDQVPTTVEPYVRPTHSAGTGGTRPVQVSVVRPRTSESTGEPRVRAER